jgi:ABC-type multidrug transport system fused ATPase/permease subunit
MTSIRISAEIRLRYLKAIFGQPISVLDTLPPGLTATVITTTANTLQVGISERLSMLLQNISLIVTAFVVSFIYSWALTLVSSSGLLLIVLIYAVIMPFSIRMWKEIEEADGKASSLANEILGSVRVVAACGAEDKLSQRYTGWVEHTKKLGLRMSPVTGVLFAPGM